MSLRMTVYAFLTAHMVLVQSLTLDPGYNDLPKPLFGSFITVNSQKEVIIIGGCDWYDGPNGSFTQCGPN